jgi:hypothetical protein
MLPDIAAPVPAICGNAYIVALMAFGMLNPKATATASLLGGTYLRGTLPCDQGCKMIARGLDGVPNDDFLNARRRVPSLDRH